MNRRHGTWTAPPAVAPVANLLRRAHQADARTRAEGSLATAAGGRLQPKLVVGATSDPAEHEADRAARYALAMPVGTDVAPAPPRLQRASSQPHAASAQVPASVDAALGAAGRALDAPLRHDMELRFGHDFSAVRIHTDVAAAQSAHDVGAHAYTAGRDIVFGAGRFAPGSQAGRGLLAHELAHVVQQGDAGTVRRFGSAEHVAIGEAALPGKDVLIVGYGKIPYGELIAIAGDYFESLNEIKMLARQGPSGIEQIEVARSRVNPARPRPKVDASAEVAVSERYARLAARNETHFSQGSAPGRSNREQYVAGHLAAIRAAYAEGQMPMTPGVGWEAQEAFSNHFLTDAFSAGHVRTQRGEIQRHWGSLYPNFNNDLIRTISCYMASYINDRDNIGYVVTVSVLADQIEPVIRAQGGAAIATFSIGDLLSKVMHDADNQGLDVVSARTVGGGAGGSSTKWRAVGDENLFPASSNAAATQTQAMVKEAVTLSYDEAKQAFSAGTASNAGTLRKLADANNFRALPLLPAADASSGSNPTYNWRVPDIKSLPANLQTLVTGAFSTGTQVRHEIDNLPVPATKDALGFTLHTGDAWNCFKRLLLANPFAMITNVCNRNVCPPGNNNQCT